MIDSLKDLYGENSNPCIHLIGSFWDVVPQHEVKSCVFCCRLLGSNFSSARGAPAGRRARRSESVVALHSHAVAS